MLPPPPATLCLPALSAVLHDEATNARTAKNLKHRMTNLRALRSQLQQGEARAAIDRRGAKRFLYLPSL